MKRTVCRGLSSRLYPRRYAEKKADSTPEIFRPKWMECTLAGGGESQNGKFDVM